MPGEGKHSSRTVSLLTPIFKNIVIVSVYNWPTKQVFSSQVHRSGRQTRLLWTLAIPYPTNTTLDIVTRPFITFAKYLLLSIFLIIASHRVGRYTLSICEGPEKTMIATLLRKMGIIRYVVYWCEDLFDKVSLGGVDLSTYIHRNILFQIEDQISYRNADAVWNFTERIMKARQAKNPRLHRPIEKIVNPPLGRLRKSGRTWSERRSILYFGMPAPHRGLELAVDALILLSKDIPDLRLEIVGTSGYLTGLLDYAEEKGVKDKLTLWGYVPPEDLMDHPAFQRALCGLAMFPNSPFNYSNYTWPSKVIRYLENGIPVITTMHCGMAEEIKDWGGGIVVNYSSDELAEAIKSLANDPVLFSKLEENISLLIKNYSSHENLFSSVLEILSPHAQESDITSTSS